MLINKKDHSSMKHIFLIIFIMTLAPWAVAAPVTPEVTACTNECVKELENACKIQCGIQKSNFCVNQYKYSEGADKQKDCRYQCDKEGKSRCIKRGLAEDCEMQYSTTTSEDRLCNINCEEFCYSEEDIKAKYSCIAHKCISKEDFYQERACRNLCQNGSYSILSSNKLKNKE